MSFTATAASTRMESAWDGYAAYLFDIDGTLLRCTDAVHYFAFCESLTAIAGRPLNLDGISVHGNTDVGILRDAFALADVAEGLWRPQLAATREAMGAFVEQHVDDLRIEVLPQVREVLTHLKQKGAVLGVATGNLERIGKAKLAHCGLLSFFDFGGWSDDFEYRRDVFRSAVTQAEGLTCAGAPICVVGDTPEDVRAARSNALDVMAVATGIFSLEELAAEQPTRLLRSFEDLILVHV